MHVCELHVYVFVQGINWMFGEVEEGNPAEFITAIVYSFVLQHVNDEPPFCSTVYKRVSFRS